MGFFQRFKSVLEPDPVRSIGPVNRSEGLLSPPQSSRMSAEALVGRRVVGADVLAQILESRGITPPTATTAGESQEIQDLPHTQTLRMDSLVKNFPGYTFDWQDTGPANTGRLTMYDPQGNQAGAYSQQDTSLGQSLMEAGMLAAAGFGGLGLAGMGPLGGLLGGAAGAGGAAGGAAGAGGGAISGGGGLTAGGSAGYGSIGGSLGASGGTTLGVAGGGLSAGAGLTSPLLQSLAAVGATSALPASMQVAGGVGSSGSGSLLGEGVANSIPAGDGAFLGEGVSSGVPSWDAAAGIEPAVTPDVFRPSVDSQAYNQSAGITGQQAANAATVPKTVNLVNAGGTMATAGGLPGMVDLAKQTLSDATASSTVGGGGLLDKTAGIGKWMASNPGLAKALLGGAGALLSTQGGGSSGGAPKQYGPAVQWKSPVAGIPQGLLGGGQQQAQGGGYPAAMGLLGGQANSGAWRFLR